MHVVVVGAGPAGATAAEKLARLGVHTTLVERNTTHPKTCGGALTPPVLREFNLPDILIERVIQKIWLVAPSGRIVDLWLPNPISLVRREALDAFLRERAAKSGAKIITGACVGVHLPAGLDPIEVVLTGNDNPHVLHADILIGADGATSTVAQSIGLFRMPGVSAYQERLELTSRASQLLDRIEVYLHPEFSPDFYAWVFPKADHLCVGTASRIGRRSLPTLLRRLKEKIGLSDAPVMRREAGFLPLHVRSTLVRGRVMLVGDAAGFVSPLSGEGIYYAMKSGECAASVVFRSIASNRIPTGLSFYQIWWPRLFRHLTRGLTLAQRFYYASAARREMFVSLFRHRSIQDVLASFYLGKAVPRGITWTDLKTILINIATILSGHAKP